MNCERGVNYSRVSALFWHYVPKTAGEHTRSGKRESFRSGRRGGHDRPQTYNSEMSNKSGKLACALAYGKFLTYGFFGRSCPPLRRNRPQKRIRTVNACRTFLRAVMPAPTGLAVSAITYGLNTVLDSLKCNSIYLRNLYHYVSRDRRMIFAKSIHCRAVS